MNGSKYPKPIEDYIREGIGFLVLEKEFGAEMYEYLGNGKTVLELVTDWAAELTVENNVVQLVSAYGNAVRFVDTGKGKVLLEGMPFDENNKWYEIGEFRGRIVDVHMKSVEKEDKIEMKTEILIECEGNSSCLKLGGENGH